MNTLKPDKKTIENKEKEAQKKLKKAQVIAALFLIELKKLENKYDAKLKITEESMIEIEKINFRFSYKDYINYERTLEPWI